jgi:hypothetical protein
VFAGCGRFAFDSVPAPESDAAIDSSVTAEMLAVGMPAEDSQVLGSATLTGTCKTGVPVETSGDIVSMPVATCTTGAFSVDVTFTPGNGDKYVILTQGADSVTRHFVRVGAAIIHRSSATGDMVSQGFNVDCTLPIAKPTGVVNGDVLIGIIFTDGGAGSSIATGGWIRLALQNSTYVAFYKIASGEPATYSFPITAGTGAGDTCESAGVISAFSGANTTTPVLVESPAGGQFSTTITAPSVTATSPGMLVALYGSNGPTTGISPPNGMTNDPTSISPGDWANALLAWQPIATGATGARTASLSTMRDSAATLVVLVP